MSRRHPRPGEEHARRLKEEQERAERKAPQQSDSDCLLAFLLTLVQLGVGGPYRLGDRVTGNLLVLNVPGSHSAFVDHWLVTLKPVLLRLCKTPIQDGLCVGEDASGGAMLYDETDLPF